MTAYLNRSDAQPVLLETHMEGREQVPYVLASGQRYDTLAALAAAHPELGTRQQLPLYCRMCLHFHGRQRYLLIDDPEQFRIRYQALVSHGRKALGETPSTADFGPYDVTQVVEPMLGENMLVFYAEDALYSVPYRVEAPWPAQAEGQVRFLLLPLQPEPDGFGTPVWDFT